ncbi:MAG TPA: chemotaxis protein CheW, partial [Longimicrobiales bacterium]|nr:chemotaxis protein CheW [Longimicrobiales bacterium]
DLASGRGVGMEVVLKTVQNIGGELRLETEKNAGTRFTIRLPLTLMIVDALLVSVAGQTYAIPQPSLREVLQISTDEIVGLENNEVIRYRDGVLPLIRLRHVFSSQAGTNEKFNVLVVGNETQQMGLVVDRLLGLREIVVRPVADPLVTVPGIAGAAELSDGSVALILDAMGLVQYAQKRKLRLA